MLMMMIMLFNNQNRAREVGYGLFSLCVIHKEYLCPSSGDINKLMMMMIYVIFQTLHVRLALTVQYSQPNLYFIAK
jgi:hypothetical protein